MDRNVIMVPCPDCRPSSAWCACLSCASSHARAVSIPNLAIDAKLSFQMLHTEQMIRSGFDSMTVSVIRRFRGQLY